MFSTNIYAQSPTEIGQGLNDYIHEKMKGEIVPDVVLERLDRIAEPINQSKKEKILHQLNHEYWSTQFFAENPKLEAIYFQPILPSVIKSQTACANGDFETGTFANYFGASGFFGFMDDDCVMLTGGGISCSLVNYDFCPAPIPTPTGSLDEDFAIVTSGSDPVIPFINQVHRGNYAAKINDSNTDFHIDKLSRIFTFDPNNPQIDFWYALILENPDDHNNRQPFFEVRIMLNEEEVTCDFEFCLEADVGDTGNFEAFLVGDDVIVYKDWTCANLDISCLGLNEGDEITVEFIAADCGLGAHFGYAYLDDICLGCDEFFGGDVNLEPLISCEQSLPISITGSYTHATVSGNIANLNSIVLEVYQEGNLITTLTNGIINQSMQTFSFELNEENFDFDGCFDVYAIATFEYNGEIIITRSESIVPNDYNSVTDTYDTDNDFCPSIQECYGHDLTIEFTPQECATFPVDICGRFDLPVVQGTLVGLEQIYIELYNIGEDIPAFTINNVPYEADNTFCFSLTEGHLGGLSGCFDIAVCLEYAPSTPSVPTLCETIDNAFCHEVIQCESCAEVCSKVMTLTCETVLEDGTVVYSVEGDIACLPQGYTFCGDDPFISAGGYWTIDDVTIYPDLYWFAATLYVTDYDYFIQNGGLYGGINICNGQEECTAHFFIPYGTNIELECFVSASECGTAAYTINGDVTLPLGWSYCGTEPVISYGGNIVLSTADNESCDNLGFNGMLYVTDYTFYQDNGLNLEVEACDPAGNMQVVNTAIPFVVCEQTEPPFTFATYCRGNQPVGTLCINVPYFYACIGCTNPGTPFSLFWDSGIFPTDIFSGTLPEATEGNVCYEFNLSSSIPQGLQCFLFSVNTDCDGYGQPTCSTVSCGEGGGGGGGLGLIDEDGIGVNNDFTSAILQVFPNPAEHYLTIHYQFFEGEKSDEKQIVIRDVYGKVVYQEEVDNAYARSEVKVRDFADGVYLISLEQGGKVLETERLIKF